MSGTVILFEEQRNTNIEVVFPDYQTMKESLKLTYHKLGEIDELPDTTDVLGYQDEQCEWVVVGSYRRLMYLDKVDHL